MTTNDPIKADTLGVTMTTPTPEELVELAERISPYIRNRLEAGQQFNAYERADGNGWMLCLGPITDAVRLGEFPTQETAEFFTEALRTIIRNAFRRASQENSRAMDR